MTRLLGLPSSFTPGNSNRVGLSPFEPKSEPIPGYGPRAVFSSNHGETGPAENGPHYHIAGQDETFGAASIVSMHDLRKVEPVRISAPSGEVLLGVLCGEAAIVDQLKLTIEGINRRLTWKLRLSASYDIVLARFTASTRS